MKSKWPTSHDCPKCNGVNRLTHAVKSKNYKGYKRWCGGCGTWITLPDYLPNAQDHGPGQPIHPEKQPS